VPANVADVRTLDERGHQPVLLLDRTLGHGAVAGIQIEEKTVVLDLCQFAGVAVEADSTIRSFEVHIAFRPEDDASVVALIVPTTNPRHALEYHRAGAIPADLEASADDLRSNLEIEGRFGRGRRLSGGRGRKNETGDGQRNQYNTAYRPGQDAERRRRVAHRDHRSTLWARGSSASRSPTPMK